MWSTRSNPRRARAPFLAALAFLLGLWACNVGDSGRTYMEIHIDESWLAYDSIQVALVDSAGHSTIIFHGPVKAVTDLNRVPADRYGGQQVQVVITGFKNDAAARNEYRLFDGTVTQLTDSLPIVRGGGNALSLNRDNLLLFLGGESAALKAYPLLDWQGKTLIWATANAGVATVSQQGVVAPTGAGSTWISAASGALKDSVLVQVVKDAPVVDAGADTVIPPHATVAFHVKVTQAYGYVKTFAWDLDGDGAYEDSQTDFAATKTDFAAPARRYDSAGSLTLKFRVVDGEGNETIASRKLLITDKAPRIDSLTASKTISIKDTVRFAAAVSEFGAGALRGYAWDYDGDGAADDSLALSGMKQSIQGLHVYQDPGTFHVTLRVTDSAGTKAQGSLTVTVKLDKPVADAGADLAVPAAAAVNLAGKATDSLGRIVKMEWSIAGAAFQETTDGKAAFTAPGSGPVSCLFRVTDDDGLTDTDEVVITVNPGSSVGNADLKNLVSSAGTLAPPFAASTTDYVDTVGNAVASISLTASAKDSGASIQVDTVSVASGSPYPVSLPEGAETLVAFTVKAPGGSPVKTYKVKVFRRSLAGAPAVSGPASPSSNKTPTWTWSSAPGGSGDFRYELDDTDLTSGATADRKTSFKPASALADGVHTLYVQEKDGSGQWSPKGSFSVTVDATPPAKPNVTVTPSGKTNNAQPAWSWTSGGGGSGDFRYWKDNESQASAVETRSAGFTPAGSMAEGVHIVFVQERDAAGNWSDQGSAQVTIDLTKPGSPTVQGTASPTNDATPTWTWSSSEGDKTFRYKFNSFDFSSGAPATTATSYTPSSALLDGTYTLYVQESDSAGNWSGTASFPITIDVTKPNAPVIVTTAPKSPQSSVRPTMTWSSGGGNGSGVFQAKFGTNDFTSGFTTVSQAPYSFTPSSDLAEGDRTFWVREKDAAGNWSTAASRALTIAPAGQVGARNYVDGDYSSYAVATAAGQVYHAVYTSGLPKVSRVSGSGFVDASSGLSNIGQFHMFLDHASDQPWMSYLDVSDWSAHVLAYNGSSWSPKGTGNPKGAIDPSVYGSSAGTWLVYRDTGSFRGLQACKLNGSTWTHVGDSIGPGAGVMQHMELVVNSSGKPIVAYTDGNSTRASTLDAGNHWIDFGSGSDISTTAQTLSMAITSANKVYLLIVESGNYRIIVSNNGGAWQPFATGPGGVADAVLAVDASGNPYVAYFNTAGNLLYVTGYLSGSWQQVGQPYDAGGTDYMDSPSLTISPSGVPYVGFDIYSGHLNLARFSFDN